MKMFKKIIHKIKKFIGGECPSCHSTNLKSVKGWTKNTCKDCWETFNYYGERGSKPTSADDIYFKVDR
jgi:transposase-like protein